jgi:putative endopeptidase
MLRRLAIAQLLLLAACDRPGTEAPAATPEAPAAPPPVQRPSLVARDPVGAGVVAALDTTTDPCTDFYQYACGGWLRKTPLPADKPRYGRGFGELADRNNAVLRRILETAASNAARPKASAIDAKLGAFYGACTDEAAIDAVGLAPLAPWLSQVTAVKDEPSFFTTVGKLHTGFFAGGGALFTAVVEPDAKRPDVYIAAIVQGGTGLPDRDFYLKTDADSRKLLAAYQAHVATMLGFLGETPESAGKQAAAIVAFETQLATIALPRAELRDPDKTYHLLGTGGLQQLDPATPWPAYFTGLGYPKIGADLNVMTPTYFTALGKAVRATPVDVLQSYLRWQILRVAAPHLGKDIVAADFAFTAVITGAKELSPRWERCVNLTNFSLGELVGQAFVKEKFAGDSKQVALDMIHQIELAFEAGLPALAWMDPPTRARAAEKMKALRNKIGYPEQWRDYGKLRVSRADHLGNFVAARRFNFTREADRIGHKVDRDEWEMPPAIVNAYYNSSHNQMVFPAGILQPPYFSADFPMAMNFGGIGMVMGHELTHGFDDQGRKFDGQGVLREWWDPKVAAEFSTRAQCVDDLYGGIEVLPGVKLNGRLTLGENIADFGGIKQAHAGYLDWRKTHTDAPLIQGLTDEQLFFLGFAQGWCSHETAESQRLRAMTDPHSPPKQRVNVPLAHFPGFWSAWQCAAGTPMHAAKPCEVW